MASEDKLTEVARYLEGDLEGDELREFEQLLNVHQELQDLVKLYQHAHQHLKMKLAPDAADQDLKALLAAKNAVYFGEEPSVPVVKTAKIRPLSTYLKWISIAAVLVVGLLIWAPWSVNLYEKYAISRQMSIVERGDEQNSPLERAAVFYNQKDYPSALKLLTEAVHTHPEHALTNYYYGITLIESGKVEEGRSILLKLSEGTSVFKYEALYMIALSYVKEHRNKEALDWLRKLPEGDPNYERATALRKALQ